MLCAPEAADCAAAAALFAAAASLEAFAVSLCSLPTCDFRSSIWAWIGFRSVQPAKATTQATAREAFSHDLYVVLPSDACASWDAALHQATLDTAAHRYGVVCTVDDLLNIWSADAPRP